VNDMDEATAFHTAARRYCENEFARSSEGAVTVRGTGKFGGTSYLSSMQFFEAALVEVEKLIPAQFQSMEDLRPLLLRAGESTQEKIAELADAQTQKIVADQAGHYRAYIIGLTGSSLAAMQPLPHRRTLDEDERRELWAGLRRRWNLDQVANCINMLDFHEDLLKARHGVQILRDALVGRGISNVLQFHDIYPDLEIDVSIFDPYYGFGEVYSTSHSFDWLVYAHHERFIAIGVDWLMEIFEQQWPDWRDKTYVGPASTADLRGSREF
jgi:hypothetical protein